MTKIVPYGLIFALLCTFAQAAWSNVRVLPRSIDDYKLISARIRSDDVVWVEGATLAWVNYQALRRDFESLNKYSEGEIDSLLLKNFSYISKHQLGLNGIRNSEIPADLARTRKSFRPPAYGRADILEFLDFDGRLIGVVDRKGAGVDAIKLNTNIVIKNNIGSEAVQTADHSDGLMTLGESLVETTRERARQALYRLSNTNGETVESYFVLMFPFKILKGNGNMVQAGLYARQAHLGRMQNGFASPLPESETLAVQQDYFGAGVDQGLTRIIDPRLRSTFGNFGPRVYDSQKRADWAWAHQTASAFVESRDRSIVQKHVEHMLAPLEIPADFKEPSYRGVSAQAEIDYFFKVLAHAARAADRRLVALALRAKDSYGSILSRPELERLIEALLQDPDADVRTTAAKLVGNLEPEKRLEWIQKLKNESNELVRILLNGAKEDHEKALLFRVLLQRLRDNQLTEFSVKFKFRTLTFSSVELRSALESELNEAIITKAKVNRIRAIKDCTRPLLSAP